MNDVSELAAMELPALRSLHLDRANLRNVAVLAHAAWLAQLRALRIRDPHWLSLGPLLRARGLAGARDRDELERAGRGRARVQRFVVRGTLPDELVARLRARWGDILEIRR